MSYDVPEHHVQQYNSNVRLLSQQKMSRLRRTVRVDGDIQGERVSFDRLSPTAAQRNTTRHADTPLMNTPHSRRWAEMFDYDWGDLVDKTDKLKTIYDPTNPYAVLGARAMGRSMDDVIIEALGGTAITGKAADGTQALPSGQKVVHGSANLTVAKMLSAKELLDAAEVDESVPRYIVCAANQITGLLNTTEVKSSDYNTVKALAEGQLNSYLGFEFIRSQRLSVDGSGNRLVYAFTGEAVGLGLPLDVTTDIGPRRDKRMATQVYVCMSLGAVRIEDEQVVEIACVES